MRITFTQACIFNAALLSAFLNLVFPGSNFNSPLNRAFSLRNTAPLGTEWDRHASIQAATPLSFILPWPCRFGEQVLSECGDAHGLTFADSSKNVSLSVSPLAGMEYRRFHENIGVFEAGVLADGSSGPLSFYLDARTYSETHEEFGHTGYDREPLDKQDGSSSGGLTYTSYSRYRGHIALDLGWARLAAGRDGAHWGPGVYDNLMFNQDGIPFNQLSVTTRFGPITIHSLYGQLVTEGNKAFDTLPVPQSVFGHRYEWAVLPNLTLGISEQIIQYKRIEPFAFVPFIPLFVFKGDGWERLNNGSISADFGLRLRESILCYSEFLIDDMQSPGTLFSDGWGNKWGWLVGAQFARNLGGLKVGAIAEYSRLEPWVYTHYSPNTAQSANFGYPLGNQLGPNSQSIILSTYMMHSQAWRLGLAPGLTWKGKSPGSELQDSHRSGSEKKSFLAGHSGPEMNHRLQAQVSIWKATFRSELRLYKGATGWSGIQYCY